MMSLPVEKLCAKMDEMKSPDTINSLLIEKYFDQADGAELSQSGTFDGFSPLNWKGFVINKQSFYFTPTSWNQFSYQHITLDCIKIFNINHAYWLPGELLLNTILKMPMLEELSIKGTLVCTVVQVAKILQSCPNIKKLDFTYTEKSQEEISSGLEQENVSLESFATRFQKLTSLKLSTTVPDRKHDVFPPRPMASHHQDAESYNMLFSFCRDCTELAIEITFTGKTLSRADDLREKMTHLITEQRVKEVIEKDWLPQLAWMISLKSLVLVKLGPCATSGAGARIISILLDSLACRYLFPHREEKQTSRPLERLWIQGFEIYCCSALQYLSPELLQSYLSGDCDVKDENYESFPNLEHLGGMMGINFSHPLPSLKKLKYASGRSSQDEKFYEFCLAHPELEGLSVKYWSFRPDLASDTVCKLPKLKSFSCERLISKAFVETMAEAFPILEILRITTYRHRTIPPDHQAILSAFRFPHLTFLSLCNFQLLDGAALIPMTEACPKLQIVHLETDSLDPASFPSNLELFLRQATNLRDFRLEWNHQEDIYSNTAISMLKALFKGSVQLERLALIVAGPDNIPGWKPSPDFADFLVEFTAKMTHLTCCCLVFNQLGVKLIKEIKQRVEKEVVIERPSLWFHLDRALPEASDPGVPAIHYHQIVYPISYFMPRF